jgi:protein AFG1
MLRCVRLFASKSIVSHGPLKEYEKLVQSGLIRNDEQQRETVRLLDRVFASMREYSPPLPSTYKKVVADSNSNWLGALWSSRTENYNRGGDDAEQQALQAQAPKGVYLYGDVGTGKTFLMDLFYDRCTFATRKRRVHFHAFMIDVHKSSFALARFEALVILLE